MRAGTTNSEKASAFISPLEPEKPAMNLDPIRDAASEATGLLHSLLQSMPDTALISPDQGFDDGTGFLMPALAGIAAAITVALMLAIYFETGYRSYRDMIRHGLTAAAGLSLLAFAAYDMRNVALAHLAPTSARPATQFELRWRLTTDLPEAHQG
jgi:hypothetical protein